MIQLTRLNGQIFYLNEDFIQFVEETPDTLISLIDGQRIVVRESAPEIGQLIIEFRAAVIASAGVPVAQSTPRNVAYSENPHLELILEETEPNG